MKSAVRRILLMSALMSPNALFALGLGEIRLNSALNQPFDADIDLISAADEDLSALRASLASAHVTARAMSGSSRARACSAGSSRERVKPDRKGQRTAGA